MTAPLAGLKILDLTRLLPGPFCTRLLANLGADVVKVEDPSGGDYSRYMTPSPGGIGAMFGLVNAAKRSVALDLKNEAGRVALRRLVRNIDILIEGFRPGVLDRLGVGYEQLRREQPRLIYAALTGYGAAGPLRDRAGHDLNYCALAGVTGLTGGPDSRPIIPAVQIADLSGALYTAFAIVAAVHGRAHNGQGCFIDAAMADAAQSLLVYPCSEFSASGRAAGPAELTLTGARVCYCLYATSDGRWMALGALEPKFWQAFCRAAEKPHLADDGFADARPGDPAYDEVAAWFASRTQAEWIDFFAPLDCCCEPVLRLDEALQHPHFVARGGAGHDRQLAAPLQFTPPVSAPDRQAPALGEHTGEVLRENGFSDDEIADLAARGAFGPGTNN